MEEETVHVPQSTGHPADKLQTRWAIGFASVAALAVLALLVLVILGRQQAARVKNAIENILPDYCQGTEARMHVYPEAGSFTAVGTFVPFPARRWHVHCWTTATCQPIITVDRQRCEARIVTAFSGTYTKRLEPCP